MTQDGFPPPGGRPEDIAIAAMKAHLDQRNKVDEQIKRLREVTSGRAEAQRDLEIAVLAAESNRELAGAIIMGAETVDFRVQQLDKEIGFASDVLERTDSNTKRLADSTKRLVWATWVSRSQRSWPRS